jgi:putative transposase
MGPLCYRRHRFPPETIQHAIWLYLRFTLSYRDVEELLAERGLDISYETVRRWVLKFGPAIARRLRQRRPRPSDRWHLDEMVVRIAGERMYLWRAVDEEGEVSRHAGSAPARYSVDAAADAQAAQEARLRAEISGHRHLDP